MRKWIKALLVGATALAPVAANAAIDNTHHDIPFMGQSTEKCARCHSLTNLAAQDAALGKTGGFCVSACHLSGSALSTPLPDVVPTSPGVFTWTASNPPPGEPKPGTYALTGGSSAFNILTLGHRRDRTILRDNITGGTAEYTAIAGTGWPYTAQTAFECTGCHAVHDAQNPPFLNAKLASDTITATPQADNFCARCHNNAIRVQDFSAAGDHPTEFEWNATSASGRANAGAGTAKTSDAATVMNGRRLDVAAAIGGFSGVINVPGQVGPSPGAAMADNVAETGSATTNVLINGAGNHWKLGGHVVNRTTGMPTSGASGTAGSDQFGCYSCHAVHASTTATGRSSDILVVGANLQTVCYGCHTVEPGLTGFGHPINPETPTANTLGWNTVTLTADYTAIAATIRRPLSLTDAPYCVSCHDVHGGVVGRMAIRAINDAADAGRAGGKGTITITGSACELCHAQSFANPTTANEHHPGAAGTDYNTTAGFAASTGWLTTDGLGDLNDGLTCPDCHIGDGRLPNGSAKRATAHNWN